MGCTGGGWRKGGGEESGYFSAYSSCAASVILVLWRIVPYPTQKPPPEVQPPLDGSAFVLGPACPSRSQGEHTGDAYIYVQYLKAVNQIQTLKFSFFHFDKYAFIMTLKKNLLGNPQDKYPLSLTHEGGCSSHTQGLASRLFISPSSSPCQELRIL